MSSSDEEKRGYAKGYAAGRKFSSAILNRQAAERANNRFWQQAFCAALTGTLSNGNWRFGDVPWGSSEDYTKGCASFADKALKEKLRRGPAA